MPVAVCPNGHRIQIQDQHIGRTVNCPSCHASFVAMPQTGGPGEDAFTDMSGGGMGAAPGAAPRRRSGPGNLPAKANWFIGKPLLFIGLILVLFGRGCDSISMRSVGRANAVYQLEKTRKMIDATTPEKMKALQEDKALKQMQEDAAMAGLSHNAAAYWYVWIFVFGTLLLMLGLLVIAFTAQGSEKWVAYIIIAIVTFSIYVGGAAWIESVVSSFSGMGQPSGKLGKEGFPGGFPPVGP